MAISNKTRNRVGLPPKGTEESLAAALGVQGSTMIIKDEVELSKAEQELLQSRALTVEDDPWNQLPNERKTNLIKHTYDPVVLTNVVLQNNTLGQCVDAYEVNIDGTGYDIERLDGKTPEDVADELLQQQQQPPMGAPEGAKPNPFAKGKPEPGKKPNPFAKATTPFEQDAEGEDKDEGTEEPDDAMKPEEPVESADEKNIRALKGFFDEVFINESFTSIRRKVRRDRETTGNGYMEVIRDNSGEITLINHLDAKLVRMVKLDEPVTVEKTITRRGTERKVQMLVRERRYAMMIGNKVRYFREFGTSREVNADTGEWMGPARKAPPPMASAPKPEPKFQATNDNDKLPKEPGTAGALEPKPNPFAPKDGAAPAKPATGPEVNTESSAAEADAQAQRVPAEDEPVDPKAKKKFGKPVAKKDDPNEFPPKPVPVFHTGPRPEDDPTKRPDATGYEENAPFGTEVIAFRSRPDVSTPYGIPCWINQIPSALGSRKAEELNLEYFNHGGVPPVMIFLQGGQLSQSAKTALNSYLSGQAKTKMRAVVADVYATGGDLTSNSQVKVNVERFGGDRLADSMFEGYDERCSGRVRSSFRLPPLFTGDTSDYTFATAYASYVVAEAQVFKPEREAFDEVINNTIMKELGPDYVYRSLPLTVHDVAVQLQAMTLAKDVTDRKTFVDELNEIAGLSLTFQDPMTDPMNPMAGMMGGGLPGQDDPFADPDADPNDPEAKEPGAFDPKANPFGNPADLKAKSKTKVPTPTVGGKPTKPMPSNFAKLERERIMKMGDESFTQLAHDWAAHLSGDRQFGAASINFMKTCIDGFNPQVRKLFNAYVGLKLAPGASYDPDGVADLMACAGDCLHS